MTQAPRENRIERNSKAVYGVLYSFIGLALLIICFFAVKIMRDEVNRGYERTIIMREPRISSDISQKPGDDLLKIADGLANKPYRMRTDENGFIKPSAVHESPELSIVFLGGSTTECHFMDEDARFPYLVGRSLETSLGKRVNSYNTGRAGNSSLHSNLLLQAKVLPMRPRVAVLMECINDLTFLAVLGDYWSASATRGIVQNKDYNFAKRWISEHIVGHKTAPPVQNDEFSGSRSPAANLSPQAVSSSFRKNVELFVFLCKQHGITPVLMTQFNRFTPELAPNLRRQMQPVYDDWGISYEQYLANYNALNDTLRQVAKEQNLLLIDLDRMVPKTKDSMYDVVHLNENGSRLVADLIAKALEPTLRK
ncbi:SGNH/GDSL hydrolase family protein [Humidesulfovibrio sp.]